MNFCSKPLRFLCFVPIIVVCFFSSCSVQERTTVKNYPVDTPFVFDNKIILDNDVPKDEKKKLSSSLQNYWDDSLRVPRVQQFGFFYKIKNPPVFDTTNITRSKKFMDAYLQSQGYYYAQLNDTFHIDTFKNQLRTIVEMNIDPGKTTIIDSLGYDLNDTTLEQISLQEAKNSTIKPGKTVFTKDIINNELDRLISLYRQNGYFKMNRDNIYAEVDTTNTALLQLTLDPFAQAALIAEEAQKRKQNPTSTVVVKDTLPLEDSSVYNKYYIGNIYYYPETAFNQVPDSLIGKDLNVLYQRREFTEFGDSDLFKFKPLRLHTFMKKGDLYNENFYLKTMNNLSAIGAWQTVDSRTVVRDDTVDFHYFLVPAVKNNLTIDLEASRNTGDFLSVGNLFGLAINTTYRNRNVWKRAIQSSTNFRNGVELSFDKNNALLQTFQSSLGQTFSFPNFIVPFKVKGRRNLDGVRTLVGVNAAYSERKDFFRLRSLVMGWGYEWKKRNKVWQYKPLNIELYSLDTLRLLDSAFIVNPYLRNAFNTGSIVSQQLSFNVSYPTSPNAHHVNFIRMSIEEAGGIFGRIKDLQDNIYQYLKLEGEYRHIINFRKTSLAFRGFGGIGYNYGKIGNTLPFYKQFIAGGPNSMRAWSLRQLGLGSSILNDTSGTKTSAFRDRYGDMQLEANIEYRYPIATISSLQLNGALFTDIGNIWNIKKNPYNPNSEFSLNRLAKDIAIGIGTGLRFDFSYFLVRVDFGLKLKDPARRANNGWLDFSDFTWRNYEFEKRDEKGNVISPNRNNFAIQLGIGLPF